MNFTQIVLQAMVSLPHYYADRSDTPEQRAELYRPVAEQIAEVSRGNRSLAAAMVTLGWFETRFAKYVLTGNCLSGPPGARCDYDHRTRRPLARGAWQLHRWCQEAWKHPEGSTESLKAEARCAARRLAWAKRRCAGVHPDGDLAGMFSGYAAGACVLRSSGARARRMALVEARLR